MPESMGVMVGQGCCVGGGLHGGETSSGLWPGNSRQGQWSHQRAPGAAVSSRGVGRHTLGGRRRPSPSIREAGAGGAQGVTWLGKVAQVPTLGVEGGAPCPGGGAGHAVAHTCQLACPNTGGCAASRDSCLELRDPTLRMGATCSQPEGALLGQAQHQRAGSPGRTKWGSHGSEGDRRGQDP